MRKQVFGWYVREYYGIAIEKGMHVEDEEGRRGVIVGATNYVQVQLEGQKGRVNFHPEALSYPALSYVGTEIREARAHQGRAQGAGRGA